MIDEAKLIKGPAPNGLVPEGPGWFVLNARDALWFETSESGTSTGFEGRDGAKFSEYGINIHVLKPGQYNGMYHSEDTQEDFLVLSGECIMVIEGEERHLKQWDFVHCPPNTEHIFVGSGDGPCAILMTGGRPAALSINYPVSEVAAKYGASVKQATPDPDVAYAESGDWVPVDYKYGLD